MKTMMPLVTCEHASNQVPSSFKYLFTQAEKDLKSHRGWDPGARQWAKLISTALDASVLSYEWTRLLLEINRAENHPDFYSSYSRHLPNSVKKYLIDHYYRPYRQSVTESIKAILAENQIALHLSVHSFTPIWNGVKREVEVGLLFDDDRLPEKVFCQGWKEHLLILRPDLIVRFNEPYLGKNDGICTSMRGLFSEKDYLGIELEVNQKFLDDKQIASVISRSLKLTFDDHKNSRHASISR